MFVQVRYLGEEGANTPLVAAVSMCNPFNLVGSVRTCSLPPARGLHVVLQLSNAGADWQCNGCRSSPMLIFKKGSTGMFRLLQRSSWHLRQQTSWDTTHKIPRASWPCRFYDSRLAKSLRSIFLSHESLFLARGGNLRPDVAASCKSIREFDDAITRVTFGMPVAGRSASIIVCCRLLICCHTCTWLRRLAQCGRLLRWFVQLGLDPFGENTIVLHTGTVKRPAAFDFVVP